MSKTTLEQFCQYLVEKYLKGKTYSQVIWSDVYQRMERQNLTVQEEVQVRDFIAAEHSRMAKDEAAVRREQFARKKEPSRLMVFLGLA